MSPAAPGSHGAFPGGYSVTLLLVWFSVVTLFRAVLHDVNLLQILKMHFRKIRRDKYILIMKEEP